MKTDIGGSIRQLVEQVAPVELDEVTRPRRLRSQPASRRSGTRVLGAGLLVAGVAVVASLTAASALAHRSLHHTVSVGGPPSTATPSVSTTVPAPAASGPPFPGCTWTQPQWDPSAPQAIKDQGLPAGFWSCPGNVAEAEEVMNSLLPDPVLPDSWKLATGSLFYGPSPRSWALERVWTPTGTVAKSVTQPQIDLRIYTQQPGQTWPLGPVNHTLANGTAVNASLSTAMSQIEWTHNGLNYRLNTSAVAPSVALEAANSLT